MNTGTLVLLLGPYCTVFAKFVREGRRYRKAVDADDGVGRVSLSHGAASWLV